MQALLMCRPSLEHPGDRPFLIEKAAFLQVVHHENFLCRDAQHVFSGAYLKDWFDEPDVDGTPRFKLPVVYLDNGRMKFINGRHRVAVLLEHLDVLPMALAGTVDHAPADLLEFRRIAAADLASDGRFAIPSLPRLPNSDLKMLADTSRPRIPTPNPW